MLVLLTQSPNELGWRQQAGKGDINKHIHRLSCPDSDYGSHYDPKGG